MPDGQNYTPRLLQRYKDEIRPKLSETFGYTNPHQVPELEKIVLNVGVGDAVGDSKQIDRVMEEITAVSGQKPVVTRAKRPIAGFRLRKGMPIGVKVTMRRWRMYEFLDRLITVAMPRLRDFRGVSPKSFDGGGNFATGLKEQIVFPEINYDRVDKIRGMDVIICTTANTDDEARELLRGFDMPFTQ